MKYYVFAKFFQHLSADELMAHCAEAKVDGPTAVIREGYWLEPESYAKALPGFMSAAKKAGLEVRFADTSFLMDDLAKDHAPLKVLADNGITDVRLGYVKKGDAGHVRNLCEHSRRLAEGVAVAAEKANVKAVIQLHGGMYPHNASTAWPLVEGLNPKFIGIMIDPGNNFMQEGYEQFDYQIQLLGECIAAVGAKDSLVERTSTKGWERKWAPVYEGLANWEQIYAELNKIGFSGSMITMPFYHTDDFPLMFDKFKREVEYLKGLEK
jgi:sugar phosphate isomerase/epimerase